MITKLNKRQLAFILSEKVEDTRAMMCSAWATMTEVKNTAYWNKQNKVVDKFPEFMDVPLLAAGLNMPGLQQAINDIHNNYLKRAATRKWILCDIPEKQIEKNTKTGRSKKPQIPVALRSLISDKVRVEVASYWQEKYPQLYPEYV